jgi:replication factor A1
VVVLDDSPTGSGGASQSGGAGASQSAGLDAFADGESPDDAGDSDAKTEAVATAGGSEETVEFTGTVVQTGDPVILDDGEETLSVETSATVQLGQEVTVRGTRDGDRVDAEDVF